MHQNVTDFGGVARDVIAMAQTNLEAVIQVFFIREGKLIGRDHYHLKGIDGDAPEELVQSFIKQFYAGTAIIPKEIMIESKIEDRAIIETWLSNRRRTRPDLGLAVGTPLWKGIYSCTQKGTERAFSRAGA